MCEGGTVKASVPLAVSSPGGAPQASAASAPIARPRAAATLRDLFFFWVARKKSFIGVSLSMGRRGMPRAGTAKRNKHVHSARPPRTSPKQTTGPEHGRDSRDALRERGGDEEARGLPPVPREELEVGD